jgi:hypothetical protein
MLNIVGDAGLLLDRNVLGCCILEARSSSHIRIKDRVKISHLEHIEMIDVFKESSASCLITQPHCRDGNLGLQVGFSSYPRRTCLHALQSAIDFHYVVVSNTLAIKMP